MNNKKAKQLRKVSKRIKPWVQYEEQSYHEVGKTKNGDSVIFTDPIKMKKCGRLFYKTLKKR